MTSARPAGFKRKAECRDEWVGLTDCDSRSDIAFDGANLVLNRDR